MYNDIDKKKSGKGEVYLHIGYHKTGTTYLQTKVFPTIEGITYFLSPNIPELLKKDYSDETAKNLLKDIIGNISAYDKLLISKESMSGGIWIQDPETPFHYADKLKMLFPRAKIILCIREQKSFILSHYAFLVKRGSIWRSLNSLYDKFFEPFYRHKCQYDLLLRHYMELFGKDNVQLLVYEELSVNPERYLKRIEKFIGVKIGHTSSILQDKNVVNASIQSSWYINAMLIMNFLTLGLFTLLRKFKPVGYDRAEEVRRFIRRIYEPLFRKLLSGKGKKLALNEMQVKQIEETFAASNTKTARYSGIDLKEYGYAVED